VISGGSVNASELAKSLAVPPGPPGLTNSGPMRSPLAGTRATLIGMVSPSGWS
jgi:hypothetical protein